MSAAVCALGGCRAWNARFALPPRGVERHVRIVDRVAGTVKHLYFRGHAVDACRPCREAEEESAERVR